MCTGSYSGLHGRPVIEATVLRLPESDAFSTSFLIDTGADSTVISGIDAVQSGFISEISSSDSDIADFFPDDADIDEISTEGVGGNATAYRINESIMLGFIERSDGPEPDNLHVEVLGQIHVVPSVSRSLLGRDVLDRFDITLSAVDNQVLLERNSFGDGVCMNIALDGEAISDINGI